MATPRSISALWVLQERFADTVTDMWQRRMEKAIKRVSNQKLTTKKKAKDALLQLDRVAKSFGKSAELRTLIKTVHQDAYAVGALVIRDRDKEVRKNGKLKPRIVPLRVQKAKVGVPKSITAGFSFEKADRAALKALDKQALIWFRDTKGAPYFDPKAREAILEESEKLIGEGVSGSEVATVLATKAESLYGVGSFASKSQSYWAGVAEHAATTAGIRGQLGEMTSIGWTRYEIINPDDERTTDICQALNGKTAFVEDAIKLMDRVDDETTVEGVKKVKPFASGGKAAALPISFKPGSRDLSSSESQSLSAAGFGVPPFHFRCRSYIDISYVPGDPIP